MELLNDKIDFIMQMIDFMLKFTKKKYIEIKQTTAEITLNSKKC